MSRAARPARVAILAYDGVDELDLVGVYVPLVKAAQGREPRFPIRPVLAGPTRRVRGSNGLTFHVTASLDDLERAEALAIPGGPGAQRLHEDPRVSAALRRIVARDVPTYTICSGVFVLARLGLIEGRRVAVHARKHDELRGLGASAVEAGYVEDGNLRSIGGSPNERYVKGVEVAFQILNKFCPDAIPYVAERLETWPAGGGA